MSRGYRGIFAAAVYGLVSFLALGGCLAASTERQRQSNETIRSDGPSREYRQQPQQAEVDRAGLPRLIERALSNPQPQNGEERENRDLAAQETMAVLAAWMVIVAALQTLVATIGIYYIRRTIKQGGEALEIARDSTKVEQRAWIKFEISDPRGPESFMGQKRFLVHGRFKNIGQTPALDVIYWSEVCFANPKAAFDRMIAEVKTKPLEGPTRNIFPQDDVARHFGTTIDEMRRVMESGDQDPPNRSPTFLLVVVQYRTVFGPALHYTGKSYRVMPGGLQASVDFDHNYSKGELTLYDATDTPGYID